ncbi:YlcI/YnfO family protein [Halothiobacillus diazotrophicus]|uniref:YlcI/YnfO family protein n=1 Tax=Halothiobacillus diazotrophicus TaxID=1860122 RepID=UPI0009EF59C4|nr:YlcI/YnfO family protein [Halothiobacillus diazotrophicus]
MKNATLPPLRVDSALRTAAESVLREGETLSSFVLEAVRLNIERREARQEFVARSLKARDEARAVNGYVSSQELLTQLDALLVHARDKAGAA